MKDMRWEKTHKLQVINNTQLLKWSGRHSRGDNTLYEKAANIKRNIVLYPSVDSSFLCKKNDWSIHTA